MIEHLLHRMSEAATHDLGIILPPASSAHLADDAVDAALRFTTPFYYRRVNHPFHIALLVEPAQLPAYEVLTVECAFGEDIWIEPLPKEMPLSDLQNRGRLEWTLIGKAPARGEITARVGPYWAWCEVVVADDAAGHHRFGTSAHPTRRKAPRDHGIDMFLGYEFRDLGDARKRAVYDATDRKILINTGAPTVQLYIDGRGYFRDSARLLLAELFMDAISDELASRLAERTGKAEDGAAIQAAKQEIIRKYGGDIHLSFLNR
jgi:hypothetical protein